MAQVCKWCGNPFKPRPNKIYCSAACTYKRYKTQHGKRYDLPTGTVGTLSELMVSTDLLIKGYEVFRAVSPACSCDLAVLKNHELKTIQVRTGYLDRKGQVKASKKGIHDVIAIVVHGDKIYYEGLE